MTHLHYDSFFLFNSFWLICIMTRFFSWLTFQYKYHTVELQTTVDLCIPLIIYLVYLLSNLLRQTNQKLEFLIRLNKTLKHPETTVNYRRIVWSRNKRSTHPTTRLFYEARLTERKRLPEEAFGDYATHPNHHPTKNRLAEALSLNQQNDRY